MILIGEYTKADFIQYVQDYASDHPESVMETPQVTEAVYGNGTGRLVELIFAYQTSRDSLRRMQAQVKPIFESAKLYVSGDGDDYQTFSQLPSPLLTACCAMASETVGLLPRFMPPCAGTRS